MESYSEFKQTYSSWLAWFFRGLLLLVFVIFIARLTELQIIKGAYYRSLADENRIREIPIMAPRGKIFARDGTLLADNKAIKKVIKSSEDGLVKVEVENGTEETITEWERVYPLGENLAHVIGFLGEADTEEVGRVMAGCVGKEAVALSEMMGRTGLEQEYNCRLRGTMGAELVEVDTFGRKLRVLGRKLPQKGRDIHTTIDPALQKKIAETVGTIDLEDASDEFARSRKVAVVATTPEGEVLSLYSSPSYNPKNVKDYLSRGDLPLFNRAISGVYHPGSVFKIVTSLAALEEDKIDGEYTYEDRGVISVNGFDYTNWYFTQFGRLEGVIGLERAIARSTDTFFYEVGAFVGPDKLAEWAGSLGYGKPTGIDIPGEAEGTVPSPAWKRAVKGDRWFLGNTYHFAIGQGDVAATPLQVNLSIAAVANGGKLCRPFINSDTGESCERVSVSRTNLSMVKNGMVSACSEGGTAYPFFNFEPVVACKTGTAETFDAASPHAWFSVFDAQNPSIVLTVLVENGGEGSRVAAPIARAILDFWFHENR